MKTTKGASRSEVAIRIGVVEGGAGRAKSAGIGDGEEVVGLGDGVLIASLLFEPPLPQLVRLCLFIPSQ